MESGQIAVGHREHTAQDVKGDGHELYRGHALFIEYAAKNAAKHRRGVKQYRRCGHTHLVHALVIERIGGGQTDNANEGAGDELFGVGFEQGKRTRSHGRPPTRTTAHKRQHGRQDKSADQQTEGRHALGRNAHGRDAVDVDSDGAPHKRSDQHQHIAQIASLQRSLLGIVSNMFHATL